MEVEMGLNSVNDGGIVADQEGLRARLRAEMQARAWSQSAAAARIEGVSQTTLNQWLGGKYPGDVAAVDAKIRRLLDSLGEGDKVVAARAVSPAWMRTETADTIWSMLAFAQHSPDIAVIASAPGVGKTVTARAYRAAGAHVWIATMDPDLASPSKMMTEIAVSLGLPIRNSAMVRRDIGERIANTGGLLVVDEAQYLTRAALDMLRSLHDRYQIGLALLGNHGFFAGVAVSRASDGFAQFFSRVGARRCFEGPRPGDVTQVLDAWGVEDAEARRFLSGVAGKPGALRAVDKCVKAGIALATADGAPLSARHLKEAWAVTA
jgi:DNA transposition AAA+ family ATPase